MNHDNTYKEIEGRNQPMQLDLLKVSSRSTSTPTAKPKRVNIMIVYIFTKVGFPIFII